MDVYSLNPQVLPGTPRTKEDHRRIFVLLGVVAVIGLIVAYQITRNKTEKTDSSPPVQTELTAEQRNQAISELKEIVSKSPPLTDDERVRAIEELKKSIVK